MWFRRLLCLIALAAFICPPSIAASASTASTTSSVSHHCADCPPPPCPESGRTRHAAGLCCPLMAQAMAVLPLAAVVERSCGAAIPFAAGRDLTGLSPNQDPPPPRV